MTDANYLVKYLSTAEMAVSEVPDACVPSSSVEKPRVTACFCHHSKKSWNHNSGWGSVATSV